MKKIATLTPDICDILINKTTESAFSGKFIEPLDQHRGSFICRGCGAALFRESAQFSSHCGWPSFDDEINGAIKQHIDADGHRQEIVCAGCDGHLGHAFSGEGHTAKNLRHCVNSLAIEFVDTDDVINTEEIIVAGGCFWGVEHLFKQQRGVLLTEVGFSGGDIINPSYQQICTEHSGHREVVRIVFDSDKTSAETLLKYFFEIHDFSQQNGQGPDIGAQYHSVIFYLNQQQKVLAQALIAQLEAMGHKVATILLPATVFWPAEANHQDYYLKTGKTPYCHSWRRVFD